MGYAALTGLIPGQMICLSTVSLPGQESEVIRVGCPPFETLRDQIGSHTGHRLLKIQHRPELYVEHLLEQFFLASKMMMDQLFADSRALCDTE